LGSPRAVPHYAFANTLSREDSEKIYERYHVRAPGSFIWGAVLVNFEPGHQEGWEEVADYALEWATEHAAPPVTTRAVDIT
jgi:hypothetical protein